MPQRETSKRRKQEDSATNAASFRLRDVTISMERISQPEGVRFTIERRADVKFPSRLAVVAGRIMKTGNGTMLGLGWWGDVTALAMEKITERHGRVALAIGKPTSKSAGAR